MRQQITLDLRDRIHGDADDDEERRPAEIERYRRIGDQHLGDEAHDREVAGADHRDAREHIVDVLGRPLAWPNARDEAAVLLEVVGGLGRVEHDRGVEEGEEHDQRDVEDEEERPAVAELRGQNGEPFGPRTGVEIGDRRRQQQQRGRKDRRDHARGIELERQVRRLPLEHAVADLAFGILDQQAALRALHEHDEGDDHDRHHQHGQDQAGGQGALTAELESTGDRRRQLRHDARQDDQRDAVADAARRHLLAEPHQEHGATGERDDRRDAKEPARIADDVAGAFQTDGDAVGLERSKHHGEIAGVLVDGLAALLAFLLELLQRRRDRRHQLQNDRGRDVRHDVEGEDRHPLDAAAREHVEHAEDAARLGAEDLIPRGWVDAGQRNVGAEPVDQERPEGEPDTLLELLGLHQRREIEVGR